MPSVREDCEVFIHEHRFLVTKLLESLNSATLPPSTITGARLRTVNDTFHKVLEKDRDLLSAVKKLVQHQVAQKELQRIQSDIQQKKQHVVAYAAQLRRSQEDVANVLKKHERVLSQAKQKHNVQLDPQEVVAYAHRIAGTTSAPKEWRPGFPMFGFMPPAPQEHMMRAGVLSRGVVDEIVTHESDNQASVGYSATNARAKDAAQGDDDSDSAGATLNGIPVGLGATEAGIRKQMPPGWKPGDPVDLPLDALLHYMGRSSLAEHGITLPETWKTGDPLPAEAMEMLRKKFKLPEKRTALYDDEVVDDVESLRKKRRLDDNGEDTGSDAKDTADDASSSESESSGDDSSDSDRETVKKVTLSLSDSDDDDDSDDDSD